MTIQEFRDYMASGKPVVGGGVHQLSQEALKITAEINGKYHTQVTKDVEPNTIVGGVPAKVIKKIEIKDR